MKAQKNNNLLRNQKGFTLIEIIAVLIILGILAAIAVPKYIDMAAQAKLSAAQGEVAEIKSSLNLAYSKLFITNSAAPTLAAVVTASGLSSATIGTAPDNWVVTVSALGAIAVISRNGDTDYNATGQWNLPV